MSRYWAVLDGLVAILWWTVWAKSGGAAALGAAICFSVASLGFLIWAVNE